MNRSTAASIVLALWVLIAAGPAAPSVAQAQPPANDGLQSLVSDAAFQFQLTYRYNVPELERRREQLQQALAAWNASARSEADNRRLAEWLRTAIRASMPGSRESLPPLPTFEPPTEPEILPLPPRAIGRPAGRPMIERPAPAPRETPPLDQPAIPDPVTPLDEPPAEHTMRRPAPADVPTRDPVDPVEEAPPAVPAPTTTEGDAPPGDFWTPHPAIDDLPEDLATGDPFLDDPLPTPEELDDLFDW